MEADAPSVHDGSNRKTSIKAALLGLKQVVGILQAVAEANPIAKACITALSVVINLELERQDNDEQIASVYHSVTTMAETLTHLTPALMHEENLVSRLKGVLDAMQRKIEEFGAFSRRYYRAKITRFIRATNFKTELQAYAAAFMQHQQDLLVLLAVRTTMTTSKILDNLASLVTEAAQNPSEQLVTEASEDKITGALEILSLELDAAKENATLGVEHWGDTIDIADSCDPDMSVETSAALISSGGSNVALLGEAALEASQYMRKTQQNLEAMDALIATLRAHLSSPRCTDATSAGQLATGPLSSPLGAMSPVFSSPQPPVASISPPASPLSPSAGPAGQYSALLHKSASQLHRQLDFDVNSVGPDHERMWTVRVQLDGVVHGIGQGRKKADAKELAARQACTSLGWIL